MQIGDIHVDLPAGLDVRDGLREYVWTFLREQRCGVALTLCLAIDFLRFLALANDTTDASLTNGHDEFIDRGVLGERKDIHRFNLLVVWVVEFLAHVDSRDVSAYAGLHVRLLQGQVYLAFSVS
jgi:hypothetical protein